MSIGWTNNLNKPVNPKGYSLRASNARRASDAHYKREAQAKRKRKARRNQIKLVCDINGAQRAQAYRVADVKLCRVCGGVATRITTGEGHACAVFYPLRPFAHCDVCAHPANYLYPQTTAITHNK